jgi:hypothetical protein
MKLAAVRRIYKLKLAQIPLNARRAAKVELLLKQHKDSIFC